MEMTTVTPEQQQALDAAIKVKSIGWEASQVFIDRDEAIQALMWAAVCGEHLILLGPPGTAKSALIRFFAKSMGQSFFRLLLNPDTQRDDLVGPIDPTQLSHGIWDRAWSGLATARLVFLDEVGKASGQVINMTLDAMEERLVTSAGQDRPIPLHLLCGATNETLNEDMDAAWDRFSLRVHVRRLSDSHNLLRMLTANQEGAVVPYDISDQELAAMRRVCRQMSKNLNKEVRKTIIKLWSGIGNISNLTIPVTDRRWAKMLVVAAAAALLDGRVEIEPVDLMVGRCMLWSDIEEAGKVQEFVSAIVDQESTEIRAKLKMAQDLHRASSEATGLEQKSRINLQADKLMKELTNRKSARSEWKQIIALLEEVKATILLSER